MARRGAVTLPTTTFEDGVATAAAPLPSAMWLLWGRPLWILIAQSGMALTIVLGFGAYQPVKPKVLLLLVLMTMAGTIVLGPIGNWRKIVLSTPPIFVIFWWTSSFLWTWNPFGYERETQIQVPLMLGAILVATLLDREQFAKSLLAGCYLSIIWTVVYTGLHPGPSMIHGDGVPGWHGGFIHKNGMAPFLVFALLVIHTFEHRARVRHVATAVSVFFIVMSQSTTSLAVGLVILPLWIVITRLMRTDPRTRSVGILAASAATFVGGLLAVLYFPVLLQARGKDLTLSRRTEIWAGVWDAIVAEPWLGYGIGGVWIDAGAQPTRSILAGLGFTVFHAHNGFLEFTLELGVIGLIGLFWLLLAVSATSLRLLRTDAPLGRFLILYVLLIVLTSLSEVTTFGIWLALLCAFRCVQVRELQRGAVR